MNPKQALLMLQLEATDEYIVERRSEPSFLRTGLALLGVLSALGLTPDAQASSSAGITYSGRLVRPDGSPVNGAMVQFRLQIRTPGSEDCLMYEELQTTDLSQSSGKFSLTMNSGAGTRQDTSGYTIEQIFANRGTFTFAPASCALTNTFTASAATGRKLRVYFNDGSFTGWEPLPAMDVNFVPYAIEANQVAGFKPTSFVRVVDASGVPQAAPALTPAEADELQDLISGQSTQYSKANQLAGQNLPALGAGQTLNWTGTTWSAVTPVVTETDPTVSAFAKGTLPTCGPNEVLKSDGTGFSCVSDATGAAPGDASTTAKGLVQIDATGGIAVASGVISLPDTGVVAGTHTKVTVDAKGRVTTGANLAEADIPTLTTAGKVSGGAINTGTIGGNAAINTTGAITTTGNITSANVSANNAALKTLEIFKSDNSAKATISAPAGMTADYSLTLPVDDGTPNQVLATDGTGVLSWIDRLAGAVTSVGGTAPVQVGGTASAPVISVDAASTTATGVVQLATNGETTAGEVVQANDARLSDGRAPIGAAAGDLTDNYPNPTVAALRGKTVATTNPLDGQVYRWNNTASEWQPVYFGVDDLRTSAGLSQFSANCAASQTLTWSAVTDGFTCTNIAIANTQVSGLGTASTKDAGTSAGQVLELDGGGKVPNANLPANVLLDGGNTTAAALAVGTTGAQNVNVVSNGATVMSFSTTGAASMGGAAATSALLDLASTSRGMLIPRMTTAQRDAIAAPATGLQIYNTTTNQLNFYNGGAWQALGVAGAGMQSLNGQTGTAQTFAAPGTTGTAPAWSSAGDAHTLNIPLAATAGVTAGLISKAEFDTFNAKVATTRTLTAGTGLTGGGDLSADRTFAVNVGTGANQIPQLDGSGKLQTAVLPGVVVLDGGNATAAAMNVGTTGAQSLNLITNNTARATITSAGNVGIGTTSPSWTLDVTGTVRSLGTNYNGFIAETYSDVANSPTFYFKRGRGTSAIPTYVQTDDALGTVTFRNHANSIDGASIAGRAAEDHSATHAGSYLVFRTIQNGGNLAASERMRIDHSGRVAIGTAAPAASAILDVASTTSGVLIPRMTTAQRDAIAAPATGLQVYNTTTNQVNYYNGSAWQALGVAGAGMQSLNGQTGTAQTFAAPGTTGTAPAWSSAGDAHTLNIPMAATAGVTAGLLSKAQYDALNAKLGAVSNTATLANGKVWIGDAGNLAQEQTISGDLSLTNTGATTVTKIQGDTVSATNPTNAQILVFDGTEYKPVSIGTDITMTNAGAVTIANNAVTTAKINDLAVTTAKINDGAVTTAKAFANPGVNRLVATDSSTGAALAPITCGSADQVLKWTVATGWQCDTVSNLVGTTAGGFFKDGGNTAGANLTLGSNDNYSLNFETNNVSRMSVTNIGDVGVGTTPRTGYTGSFSPNANVRLIELGGSGTESALSHGALVLANNRPTVTTGDTLGSIWFTSKGNAGQSAANINANLEGAGGASGFGANLSFSTKPDNVSSNAERMRITGAGFVGIATTAPTSRLDVRGSLNNATNEVIAKFARPDDLVNFTIENGVSGGNGMLIGTRTAHPLAIQTGATERMRIEGTTGNVGIGTATPGTKLEVAGNALLNTSSGDPGLYINKGDAGVTNTYWGLLSTGSGSTAANRLSFGNNNAAGYSGFSEKMVITNAGNVGIGTTTPGQKLEVYGGVLSINNAAGTYRGMVMQTAGANRWQVSANNTAESGSNVGSDFFIQSANDAGTWGSIPFFIQRSTGNVGIGTQTPATLLNTSLASTTLYTAAAGRSPVGTQLTTINTSSTTGAMSGLNMIATSGGAVQQNAHIGAVSVASGYGAALVFGAADSATTYAERMRIDQTGALGVGTAAPAATALLDIASTTRGVLIPRMTTAQRDAIASPANGLQIYNTTTSQLNYYNGSAWQALGIAGAGIGTLNGQTGSTQTFATPGTSGTAPAWSSAANAHTLNIPLAATAGVTAGLISKAQYDAFNAKLGAVSNAASLANGKIWIGDAGGLAQEQSISGDLSLTNTGATTVTKIQGDTVSATNPTNAQILVFDGTEYKPVSIGTDVTMTNAGAVTIANNAVTTVKINNLAVTTAKIADAAVTTAKAFANPGVNRLVATDSSTGANLAPITCGSADQVLKWTVATGWQCDTVSNLVGAGAGGFFKDGGNTAGANLTLGANDNYGLNFETNGTTKMTITNAGNVGIATSNPDFGIGYTSPSRIVGIAGDGTASGSATGVLVLANNRATPTVGDTAGTLDFVSVGNGSGVAQLGARMKSVLTGAGGANGFGHDIFFATKGDNAAGIAERVRITASGSVGIGTTTPTHTLDVVGSARVSGTLRVGGDARIENGEANEYISMPQADDSIRFFSNNVEKLTILNDGKIGMGTATPSHSLSVVNSIAGYNYIEVNNDATPGAGVGSGLLFREGATDAAVIRRERDGTGAFNITALGGAVNINTGASFAAATAKLTVTNAGNVGVGVAGPTAALQLKAGTATAGTAPLKFTSGTLLGTVENGAMEYDGTDLYISSGGTRRKLASTSGTGDLTGVGNITGSGAITIATGGTTNNLSLTSSGTSGNVNVTAGTSSGSINLTPGTTGVVNVNSTVASTSTTTGALVVDGGLGVAGTINAAIVNATTSMMSPVVRGSSAASGTLTLESTSNGTKGHIIMNPTGGNVGIGTTTPMAQTEIYGTSQLTANLTDAGGGSAMLALNSTSSSAGSGGGILFGNGQSRTAGSLGMAAIKGILVNGAGNTSGDIAFSTRTATGDVALSEKMRITSSGSVGIGTASPAARLHVQGSGSANRYVLVDAAKANTTIRCDDNSTQCAGDPHLVLENRSITSVGSGLTLGFNIATGAAAGDQAGSVRVLAESDWTSAANKDSYMSLHTMLNGTAGEKVRVTSAGNVGIGLTNPTAKLQVAGQIVSNQTTIATGATVNFANGNTQVLNSPGGAAITLQNMVHGASYTLVITDTATPRTYTFTGCNASYFNPANGNTLAGTRSVYTILAIQNGANTDCYISWITGFQ